MFKYEGYDQEVPSLADAKKERVDLIAKLRQEGKRRRADRLAQCRKGSRCNLEECPVCERLHQRARNRIEEKMIRMRPVRFIIHQVRVDLIKIVGRHRPVNDKELQELKASIAEIGLQTPITVRFRKNRVQLVAGLRRLKAMEQLGEEWIPCFEHCYEEGESYLWQRSENLYRGELCVLERAELINELRQAVLQEGQVAPPGGRQPADVGINKAAKRLGFTKEEVRRSMRMAEMIAPKAKSEARKLGLDDNQDALLQIAKLPASAQCAAVTAIVEAQRAARARLAPRAVAAVSEKAAAKIQAIEDKIAKKNEALKSLKEELSKDCERLDKVQGDLVATYVNNALITGAAAQPAGDDVVTVRGGALFAHDQPLSSNDEKVLDSLVAAWNALISISSREACEFNRLLAAVPLVVRDHFIVEYLQQVPAVEGAIPSLS
jgi:ParB family chromosome partitioning protein